MRGLDRAVRRGRAAFERRMRATCVVTRVDGVTEDENGYEVPNTVTVYEGPCYFRYPGLAFESNFDSVGVTIAQSRLVGRFPFGPVFMVDDFVTVISDPDTPHLAGTVMRVASIDDQSQATAQRLLLEDNQKGVKHE